MDRDLGLGVTSTTITIAGHAITRTSWSITAVGPPSGANTKYVWTDQGTTFQLMALITESVNKQDVEHISPRCCNRKAIRQRPNTDTSGTGCRTRSPTPTIFAVGFQIVEPKSLPNPLVDSPVSIRAYHAGNSGADKANYVELFYPQSQSASQGMFLVETTNHSVVPSINGETVVVTPPLSQGGSAREMSIISGTQMEMSIQGVLVTRFDVADSDARQRYLVWEDHGVSSYVEVTRSGSGASSPVDEGELQQMVGGLIKDRRGPGWWSSSAITDLLAILRGIILASILVAVNRLRHVMLWGWAVFAIVVLFTAFLFVDGIVEGPLLADVGLVVGGVLVLGAVQLYDRWRHSRSPATS